MRIVLTADHAGVDLKDELVAWLAEQGHDILDLGTHGHESVDYPRFGAMLAEAIGSKSDVKRTSRSVHTGASAKVAMPAIRRKRAL